MLMYMPIQELIFARLAGPAEGTMEGCASQFQAQHAYGTSREAVP